MSTSPVRDSVRNVVALSVTNSGVFAAPYTTPMIIGALIIGMGVSEAQAGSLITAELVTMGLAALVIAPRVASSSRRRMAVSGATVLLIGTVGAAYADT